MRVLSPVNGAHEARAVIEAGADELYCGVMPAAWKKNYTNVASPNRREWQVANMTGFDELRAIVTVAHARNVQVYLTMNALYTEGQYAQVQEFIKQATVCGVDAIIIADIGLILAVREMGWAGQIHVSTGGTTFNDETVAFYKDLGASRVILPRQNRVAEIAVITAHNKDIEIEAFILNCGCMNIDGFCTFHHGVKEVRLPGWWNFFKGLHWDYFLLSMLKRLPIALREKISQSSGITTDSACFLTYDLDIDADGADEGGPERLRANLRKNFNMFTGFDTCGTCAMWDLVKAGVHSIKIVGRNNPLHKKVQDVRFLKTCVLHLQNDSPTRADFAEYVRKLYKKIYGFDCGAWCYFPNEDLNIPTDRL